MTKICPYERIVTAARNLFFANGFEKVTTDHLAREASVSKATIYRHFKNMPDILRCVTEREVEKFSGPDERRIHTLDDLRVALCDFGTNLLEFLNTEDAIEFARLISEEARSNPVVANTFSDAAHGKTQRDLAALFSQAQKNEVLTSDCAPEQIAEDFIVLAEGLCFLRTQLGLMRKPYPDVTARVSHAVDVIVAAYQIPKDGQKLD
jgi:AcrR family transcriptional regulator